MSKPRAAATLVALTVAGSLIASAAQATTHHQQSSPRSPRYASGELVIRYLPGTPAADRTEVRAELGATVDGSSVQKGRQVLELPDGLTVESAVRQAESMPQVAYAEPNYRVQSTASPNDPLFGEMWSLGLASGDGVNSGIDTPRVWNLTTGGPGVTVAIVDSGVESSHPDLAPNMWSNPSETQNGADDDGNGLVDDVRGWDWVADDNAPEDEAGHGTMVAGIVGARGNNAAGVAGINWDVRMMSLRVLDANGSGWTSDVADAFHYAGRKGVQVVNASLAGTYLSQAMLEAITSYPDTLFVVAAGNSSNNVDTTPWYPCSFPLPNVLCVAATNQSDQLSGYSNFGAAGVDLAAPGDAILSTWPGGTYSQGWGTSFASPHVAGVAALLQAHHPEAGTATLKSAIMAGSQPRPSLAGRTVTGGRLSAAGAFEQLGDVVPEEQRQYVDDRDDRDEKKRCTEKRRRSARKGRRARHGFCRARHGRR